MKSTLIRLFAVAMIALLAFEGSLQAAQINVNLYSTGKPSNSVWDDPVNGPANVATLTLENGESAGVWNTTQWENVLLAGNAFSKTTPATTINGTSGSTATFEMFNRRNSAPYNWNAVRDDSDVVDVGNATLLDAHVNSTEFDGANGSGNPFGFQIADFEIRDIPFASYDAVFYFGVNGGQSNDGKGTIRINDEVTDPSVSRSPWDIGGVAMDMSGGTQFTLPTSSQDFEPDGTLDEIEFSGDTGNYIVYEGLTDSTLKVQTWGEGFTHIGATGFQIREVPEPSSLALFGLGGLAVLVRRRR